uniref:Uncharacterized protein n=1 Tax=Arundo donax TaxID=35708 RepID=A0A0A9HSV0_ARUDO
MSGVHLQLHNHQYLLNPF